MNEAKELGIKIEEFEEGESGHTFDSIAKLTMKMYRCHDRRASSYCKMPKPFCNSKSIVNIETNDNYCSLWCILAHLHEIDTHREKLSQYIN